MGGTIKGITVKIGGDTTKLKEALKGVDGQARNLQGNLKAVDRALKLDPTNTELLAEKQKILAESVQAAKDKLKTLESVQDQISQQYAAGDIDRGAYLDFQNELVRTKEKLKNLQEQQKSFGSVIQQQMEVAGQKVQDFGEKISDAGEKISDAGEKLLPVTGTIVGLGTAAAMLGSDLEESQNKVEVSFRDSADQVQAFAKTTLDAYGIAEGTALDMAALYGDMATAMEIPTQKAAEMSTGLVGLAGDLASFKNIGLDQAQDALKGIFTGETESLKNLGVVMTQTNLLQYAMEKGMIDTSKSTLQLEKEQVALEKAQVKYNEAVSKYGESSLEARDAAVKVAEAQEALDEKAKGSLDTLSQAEQVQLRYAYVMDATKNAQGDFARTSDGAANSMRVCQEAIKEAGASFGTLLTPYVAEAAQMITEIIKKITALPEAQKEMVLLIAAIVAGIGPLLIIGGKLISGIGAFISLGGSIIATGGKVASTFTGAAAAIKGGASAFSLMGTGAKLAGVAITVLTSPITWIVAGIAAVVAGIVLLYNKCEWFRDGVNAVGSAIADGWNKGMEALKTTTDQKLDAVKEAYQSNGGGIKGIVAATMTGLKEINTFGLDFIDNLTGGKLTAIKEKFLNSQVGQIWTTTMETVKGAAIMGMEAMQTITQQKLDAVRAAYERNGGGLKGIAAATMEGIKGYYTAGWDFIDTLTGGKLTAIKDTVQQKMEGAREAVSQAIEKIKSIFNFEWNWPKLKLPHFSISGSFSLVPPRTPKISVSWYAKGGILTAPTIFGASNGTLLGGGEAGPEAVLPLSGFYNQLDTILGRYMGRSGGVSVQVSIEHFENNTDQDVDELAETVAERIQTKIDKRGAVFS